MAIIKLVESDLNTNKSPRLAICLCIDVSDHINRSQLPDIENFLLKLCSYVQSNIEIRSKTHLCVVTFGKEVQVVSEFSPVTDGGFEIKKHQGEPDLSAGLNSCISLINKQIQLYMEKDIYYYTPELVLLSSGISSSDISQVAERLCIAQSNRKINVSVCNLRGTDSTLLSTITEKGKVEKVFSDFTKLFDFVKSEMDIVSKSSIAAYDYLNNSVNNWKNL